MHLWWCRAYLFWASCAQTVWTRYLDHFVAVPWRERPAGYTANIMPGVIKFLGLHETGPPRPQSPGNMGPPFQWLLYALSACVNACVNCEASMHHGRDWEGHTIYIQTEFCLWHDYLYFSKSRMIMVRTRSCENEQVFLAVVCIQLCHALQISLFL